MTTTVYGSTAMRVVDHYPIAPEDEALVERIATELQSAFQQHVDNHFRQMLQKDAEPWERGRKS